MKDIWIIGAGRFGKKAVSAIKKHYPDSDITVVDHSPSTCRAIAERRITTVCMDGVSYLDRYLSRGLAGWIIPVIPVHLVYEWVRMRLMPGVSVVSVDIPEHFCNLLPNVFHGKAGEIFVSNADFVCPDNCSEPLNLCTHTGLPRQQSLHQAISDIFCNGFANLVLQSHQLAPGIGGISPDEIFHILDAVKQSSESILLSTACRCHGVVQAFRTTIPER